MTESIIVALITGVLTLVGVILTNNKHDAVIDEKIKNLTEEVKKHNSIVERTFALEERTSVLEERVKVANNRIADLEAK